MRPQTESPEQFTSDEVPPWDEVTVKWGVDSGGERVLVVVDEDGDVLATTGSESARSYVVEQVPA